MYVTQTRRILAVYDTASEEHIASGMSWYSTAHLEALWIASNHCLHIEQAAGIIAALSPQTSWGFNLQWADLVAGGDTSRHGLGASLGKALMIQRNPGTDPLDILGGPKVRAFYSAILSGGATEQVVVDRHAYDLASNTRGAHLSLTPRRSFVTAENYRGAATRLRKRGIEITACQLQAVTWLTWRSRYWGEGAWDGYANDRSRAPQLESVAV